LGWLAGGKAQRWRESQVVLLPQGVRVGRARQQDRIANRVEGAERRQRDAGAHGSFEAQTAAAVG
jgi:hypothetical protein